MTVEDLFREKPKHWGFKGDTLLWHDLSNSLRDVPLPCEEKIFLEKLYHCVEEITGERLEDGEDIDLLNGFFEVEKVSCDFWNHWAIPLLLIRLDKANRRLTKQQSDYKEKVVRLHRNIE